jgi:CHAD domain-containing protein
MERVIERAEKAQPDLDADAVHDLRVALRRCRTMAEVLREVAPDPGWRKIKKASRDIFHALGQLRDVHVQRDWVKKLIPARDSLRARYLRALTQRERQLHKGASKAVDAFDRKHWRKLGRRTEDRAHLFPPESVVFQRLGLAQLENALTACAKAKQMRSSVAWHRTRIEIKKFRYLVENFLPQRHEEWSTDLKRLQDLLGDVHDLDMLRSAARRFANRDKDAVAFLLAKIAETRKERLAEFLAKTSGPQSPFRAWREGLQVGHTLVAAPFAQPQRRTA